MSFVNPVMVQSGRKAGMWLALLCWEEIAFQSILIG